MADSDDRRQAPRSARTETIGVFVAIAFQTFAVIWWASGINERVSALEAVKPNNSELSERVARVEEKLSGMKDTLASIDGKLDRAIDLDRGSIESNYRKH